MSNLQIIALRRRPTQEKSVSRHDKSTWWTTCEFQRIWMYTSCVLLLVAERSTPAALAIALWFFRKGTRGAVDARAAQEPAERAAAAASTLAQRNSRTELSYTVPVHIHSKQHNSYYLISKPRRKSTNYANKDGTCKTTVPHKLLTHHFEIIQAQKYELRWERKLRQKTRRTVTRTTQRWIISTSEIIGINIC